MKTIELQKSTLYALLYITITKSNLSIDLFQIIMLLCPLHTVYVKKQDSFFKIKTYLCFFLPRGLLSKDEYLTQGP